MGGHSFIIRAEGTLKTSQDAQLEADRHAAEVRDQHPEDHHVHEDGVSSQIRQGREGLEGSQTPCEAASVFYDQAEVSCEKEQPKNLYVAITSDRGLAGGVHSSICKAIRNELQEMTPEAAANTKVICVGDKSRAFMARYFPKNLIMVGSEIGRLPPQFGDAAAVANAILNSVVEYDQGKMMYNNKSVVSYDTTAIPLFSQETVMGAEKITAYDSVDADVVQSYLEFSLASLVYYAMKEGACSEQSSRMTAMDNSSKNAGEM